MYQTHPQYYHSGNPGHRATSSFNYLPQFSAPGDYYGPVQPGQPVQAQQQAAHRHSRSIYSAFQPYQQAYPSINHSVNAPQPANGHHMNPLAAYASPPKEPKEQVNGGINSVLEYDLNNMATFLSWCAFGMLKQSRNPTKEFEGLVVSVLFATRLPKSTIVIALEYMNQRFSSKKDLTNSILTEHEIFVYLVVALILANKFNDDNTFTNKSWCGATGLELALLNRYEKEWLEECKWSLNVVNFESNILTLEECWKTWLEKYGSISSPAQAEAATTVLQSPPSSVSPGYYPNSSPIYNHQYSYKSYASIPTSPVYSAAEKQYYYPSSSPVVSSPPEAPMLWSQQPPHLHPTNNIWSYTPTGSMYPPSSNIGSDPAVQYVGNVQHHPLHHQPIGFQAPTSGVFLSHHPGNFVGYANPYFMASC
ncbi:cyclin-like protein [Scheffersomyces xylosifermentans]|uniref:cyclin-like protein n=1 Tax=Scheffersomyces xylosifermentans TaxID=1304137 RepID=UPI00315D629B